MLPLMQRMMLPYRNIRKNKRRATRCGFTLLELLIVIAIIGLLIGLLLPSLKRSLDLAKATACKSNLRQVSVALTLYRLENEGWLPRVDTVAVPLSRGRRSAPQRTPLFNSIYPTYLNDR